MRIGIVVGEASGDILGAGLMAAILKRYPQATFEGIGGPRMLSLGFNSFFPQERLAVMGLIEPLKRLFELLRIRAFLFRHFRDNPPDLFLGIDSPDFNLTLEEKLRACGVRTAHYVSPSVWAWRQKRVHKIARAVDLMLTLLPFEARFYEEHGVPVEFVGHPLADEIPLEADRAGARAQLQIDPECDCVALMPGSRGGEVAMLAPLFLQAARWCLQKNIDLQFVLPAANPSRRQQIEQMLSNLEFSLPIKLLDGQSHQVLAAADAVLMASGTTSLEAMLFKRPMVVAYRFSPFTYWILSKLVKSPYIALPNLLAGEPLVPELVQDEVSPERLGEELMVFLDNPEKVRQLQQRFTEMHVEIRRNASERAAEALLRLMEKSG